MTTINSIQRLQELGQSVWFDNIRRGFIKSGELQRLIDMGVSGLTSNPSIFEKAIAGSTDYDEALIELALEGENAEQVFERLAIDDIQDAADLLRPIYEATQGSDGYASIEVSPHLAHDTAGTVVEARRLHHRLQRPNVMIKVPATSEGIPAIRQLIGEGINVNVTLIFSLESYAQVRDAYICGLEDLASEGGDLSKVSSVASFFVSRVDASVDGQIEHLADSGKAELNNLMGKAAISNAKIAYRDFNRTFVEDRFASLQSRGARVQRPLWASTSTKNPEYSDVLYVDELIGPNTVNTLPDVTLNAFLEHGNPANTIGLGLEDAVRTIEALEYAGISIKQVTDNLLADGVKAFADSYDTLIANIESKLSRLVPRKTSPSGSLGTYKDVVTETVADLNYRDVPRRIWEQDHSVWKPVPTDISNRLGWLTVVKDMQGKAPDLQSFADEVRAEGYERIVLLGMGGSSLGALALQDLFGSSGGYPELIVLDTTIPEAVLSVSESIDPSKTFFIVASKSGSTIEPNVLYKYFREVVEQSTGAAGAGSQFAAICDADTPLKRLAQEHGFRRVFTNPSDIGGRYSVQSLFGLVPAALMGIDIETLLERVEAMSESCGADVPAAENPGVWLGAVMSTLAMKGRDKLTIVTTESLRGFGLWIEQLIAESTGKEGKGIIPIVGESLTSSEFLGDDRLLVYVRLDGDDAADTDSYIDSVELAGNPTIRLNLSDKHDIGAEFFRWQFATAVAGSVMGIHPFDQPDVQRAKDSTDRLLQEYQRTGRKPSLAPIGSLDNLMTDAKDGSYLAITAFAEQTAELDAAIARFRERMLRSCGIATTFGYGPRYLHSTGQLHKGGTDSGLFLQLTQIGCSDLRIPGEPFTFDVLAAAQASGDFESLSDLGGRSVVRIELPPGDYSVLDAITDGLG